MTTIKEVVQKIIDKISDSNGYKRAWIAKYWKEIVGESADKHSCPYKIERDVLFVSVDSSVWNQELFMKKGNLIVKINQKFARKVVKDVKCQIGHFTSEVIDENERPIVGLLLKDVEREKIKEKILEKCIITGLKRKKDR